MNLFDEVKNETKAVGGLAALGAFKAPEANNSKDNVWGGMWDHRGGFDYSMPPGTTANLVFLSDITIFQACPLITKWVQAKGQQFPGIDYVRCPAFSDSGEDLLDACYITEITERSPKTIGLAKVLDMRPYKDKPFTIRPLLITNYTVLQQLATITKHQGKSLEYAKMEVGRGIDSKSARTGDSWYCTGYTDAETLTASIPDWEEQASAMDFDKGYIRPTREEAKSILRLHVSVIEKRIAAGDTSQSYNKVAWDEMNGKNVGDSPEQLLATEPEKADADAFAGLVDLVASADEPVQDDGGFNIDELEKVMNGEDLTDDNAPY